MSILSHTRVRSWFASHFAGRASPASSNAGPSRWIDYGRDVLSLAATVAVGGALAVAWCVRLCSARRGELPMVILFVAALLSALSGMLFCFVI